MGRTCGGTNEIELTAARGSFYRPFSGFLKNSEFLAASLVQMVELLIQSTNRVYAFGIPVQLKCKRREPFNSTPMGANSISPGSPHVRPMGVHRTCR